MGWFDDQIRQRKQSDNDLLADSLIRVAGAVTGERNAAALHNEQFAARNAIEEILKFFHIRNRELPDQIKDIQTQLEYLLRPHGIMYRTVRLTPGWYRDAIQPMLVVRKADGALTALLPSGIKGYKFQDPETGKWRKMNKTSQLLFEEEALVFYKQFPMHALKVRDLAAYLAETLSPADLVLTGVAAAVTALIGLVIPHLNHMLFSGVIVTGSVQALAAAGIFLVCATISRLLIEVVRQMLVGRIQTKMDVSVQAAVMMRLLSLPADFFKRFSAGELAKRSQYIGMLCTMMTDTALSVGLTSLFSLIYVFQIAKYAPALTLPAILILFVMLLFSSLSAMLQIQISRRQLLFASKENGVSYALIAGVQKIRLSGSEKRAFSKWAAQYAKLAATLYNPPLFIKLNTVISTAITLAGNFILYAAAVQAQVEPADYVAFHTAYGLVSGAFLSLSGIALTAANIKPIMDMAGPIMEAEPEVSGEKQVITKISGGIELNNVTFRYVADGPAIVDNLSLKIRPGQYIAIVGKTGCGKSTLLRLLLGFEKPQNGAIYYDGKDLSKIDLRSLRRKIGVVMQNGRLFQDDIFANITVAAPHLTLEDAWDAAEKAGIAEDIERMPMQMNTVISESGGISGGQRQRLLIARAIAPKPKILMFDEATSALDNITQKKVSQALDSLKCTRIVIAHRLSTIRQCDRILVLDHGKIVEDGSYESLLAKGGLFADLVERQRLDI
ncbi:MAG: ATP-binding cassette domain-containing protein [Oscillospiraceae bacterium]|nr:ATP-binding cassette domain-containing protein [Oscillospiraceae bacterium]